jgi:hypothetical protein
VAVSLEAARVLAARPDRQWTLLVLVTDGEESGLMGAAGLMTDRDVTDRLHAYINIEASGSALPAPLFETGPWNPWLVSAWARNAPHPRGGSYGFEIYKRLPNDTDFSILKSHQIPGLNFAAVGDSYAYHTARDTAERLSMRAVRDLGDNTVAIVQALDRVDITSRTTGDSTFFDIGGTVAASYGWATSWAIGVASLVAGGVAWAKVMRFALDIGGGWRWVLTGVWSAVGLATAIGAMIAATWGVRIAREVYHPWYARPGRLLFLLFVVGAASAWGIVRTGAWLPARAHAPRHPAVTWSVTLPVWIGLASLGFLRTPAAAYLWTLPLLTAGLVLMATPVANVLGMRLASIMVLAVSATLWLRETVDLFRFVVALFGRLPLVTPAFVYPALLAAAGLMVVPPFVAAVSSAQRLPRPRLITAACLFAIAIAAGMVYTAPAYTYNEPLRRSVRALQEHLATTAIWEVASVEPGLDLGEGAPGGWMPGPASTSTTIPWSPLRQPFVFNTVGPSLGAPPLLVAGLGLAPVASGIELTLTAIPQRDGLTVSFILPAGIVPVRTNLPGVTRLNRWTATYIAPPAEGVAWRAVFTQRDGAALRGGVRVTVTDTGFPGGEGWQRLPSWLPQDRAVWTSTATWSILAAPISGDSSHGSP